jgi:hypothetical protein
MYLHYLNLNILEKYRKLDLKTSKIYILMAKKKKTMNKEEKERSNERKEGWFRIIVLIVSGIILSVWGALIKLLIVVSFLITIVAGKRNKDIAEFSEYWNTEAYKFIRYMTFVNNVRPFPFSSIKRMSRFS